MFSKQVYNNSSNLRLKPVAVPCTSEYNLHLMFRRVAMAMMGILFILGLTELGTEEPMRRRLVDEPKETKGIDWESSNQKLGAANLKALSKQGLWDHWAEFPIGNPSGYMFRSRKAKGVVKKAGIALAGTVIGAGATLLTVLTGGATAVGAGTILGWSHGIGGALAANGGFLGIGVAGLGASGVTISGLAALSGIVGASTGAFFYLCSDMAFNFFAPLSYKDMEKFQFRLGYVPSIAKADNVNKLKLVVLVKIEAIVVQGSGSSVSNTVYAYIEEIGAPDRRNKNKYTSEHKIKFKLCGLRGGSNMFTRMVKASASDRWLYYNCERNRFASKLDGQSIAGNHSDDIFRRLDKHNTNVFGHIYERLVDLRFHAREMLTNGKLKITIRDPRKQSTSCWKWTNSFRRSTKYTGTFEDLKNDNLFTTDTKRKSKENENLSLREGGLFQTEMSYALLAKLMKNNNINKEGFVVTDLSSDAYWHVLGLRPGCRLVAVGCPTCQGTGIEGKTFKTNKKGFFNTMGKKIFGNKRHGCNCCEKGAVTTFDYTKKGFKLDLKTFKNMDKVKSWYTELSDESTEEPNANARILLKIQLPIDNSKTALVQTKGYYEKFLKLFKEYDTIKMSRNSININMPVNLKGFGQEEKESETKDIADRMRAWEINLEDNENETIARIAEAKAIFETRLKDGQRARRVSLIDICRGNFQADADLLKADKNLKILENVRMLRKFAKHGL